MLRVLIYIFALLGMASSSHARVLKVAYLHDTSSAFSERVYSGIDKKVESLEQSHNIFFRYIKTQSKRQLHSSLIKYSRQKYDLIIYAGDDSSGLLRHISSDYPRVHYLHIDGRSHGPNVSSIRFQDADIGFTMGYVAALSNKSRKIAVIAPTERVEVKDVIKPFKKGVALLSPEVKVESVFISNEESTWSTSTGLAQIVSKKLKAGYRDFFILAARGDDEWAKALSHLSAYKDVSLQVYGRRVTIPGLRVAYAYRDYSQLIEQVIKELEESRWRGGRFDMTIDTGFFKLGPRRSILGNPEAMRTITKNLKSKLSLYRNN